MLTPVMNSKVSDDDLSLLEMLASSPHHHPHTECSHSAMHRFCRNNYLSSRRLSCRDWVINTGLLFKRKSLESNISELGQARYIVYTSVSVLQRVSEVLLFPGSETSKMYYLQAK